MHSNRVEFHVPVRAIVLEPTMENRQILLNAMTDWNKYVRYFDSFVCVLYCLHEVILLRLLFHRQKETDHVIQQMTHDLKRIQHFGLLDFEELKGLISEADYEDSVAQWGKSTKKKWYHMTQDAFLRLMYEVKFISSQLGSISFVAFSLNLLVAMCLIFVVLCI